MASTSNLQIDEPQPRLLTASGVIDLHSAQILVDKLEELGATEDVLLDLSAVEFIDSSGLRAIVVGHRRLEAADRQLRLLRPSNSVKRLLEITSLDGHLIVDQ